MVTNGNSGNDWIERREPRDTSGQFSFCESVWLERNLVGAIKNVVTPIKGRRIELLSNRVPSVLIFWTMGRRQAFSGRGGSARWGWCRKSVVGRFIGATDETDNTDRLDKDQVRVTRQRISRTRWLYNKIRKFTPQRVGGDSVIGWRVDEATSTQQKGY